MIRFLILHEETKAQLQGVLYAQKTIRTVALELCGQRDSREMRQRGRFKRRSRDLNHYALLPPLPIPSPLKTNFYSGIFRYFTRVKKNTNPTAWFHLDIFEGCVVKFLGGTASCLWGQGWESSQQNTEVGQQDAKVKRTCGLIPEPGVNGFLGNLQKQLGLILSDQAAVGLLAENFGVK